MGVKLVESKTSQQFNKINQKYIKAKVSLKTCI
jgi:hypothetical protein